MKIGAENRKKVIWASLLGGLALIFVVHALMSFTGSPAAANSSRSTAGIDVPPPRNRATSRRASPASRSQRPAATPQRLDPTLQLGLLKESEDTKYEGTGRNIFVAGAEPVIPQPVAPGHTETAENTPPPPPPPPPILLKFFGFANKPGEPKKIFLSQGEDVFIAGEGDIVDRRYRVTRIGPTSVEIEDVLNNNRQMIPLTQG
ncbi:MAG TPA: hypothetical protein VFA89_24785 [Terriglobales bacterium]|nr:hypothetical protein [Terriglobales bacterium]